MPQIGACEQKPGKEFAAENFSCDESRYSADIGAAYGKGIKWNRSVNFNRNEKILFFSERYSLPSEEELILAFMTEEMPVIEKDAVIFNEGVRLCFNGADAAFEEIVPEEEYAIRSWKSVYKVTLRFKGKDGIFEYKFELS